MHAFFITRGIKREIDEFVKFLETRTFMLKFKNKKGEEMIQPLQSMLQPVQLWSFVFPEDIKDAALTSLKFDKANRDRWIGNPKMKLCVEALRLIMGAERIPQFKTDKIIPLPVDILKHISIIPIGVKYDNTVTHASGLTHETL